MFWSYHAVFGFKFRLVYNMLKIEPQTLAEQEVIHIQKIFYKVKMTIFSVKWSYIFWITKD